MKKNNYKGNVSVPTVIIIVLLTIIIVGFAMEKFGKPSEGGASPGDGAKTGNTAGDSSKSLVGKSAPTFSLADRDGNVYTNDSLKGKRVVLFFNEGLMCYPACWNQMMEFPKDKRFDQSDVAVFSVVTDTKEAWQKAIEKLPEMGTVKALYDTSGIVSKDFQMMSVPSSMHAGSMAGHTYVVMDKDGVVRYVLDDPKMAINNGTIYSEIEKLK
ncbi:MAG: redoxin family protein [Patescibacteria group bacterium]